MPRPPARSEGIHSPLQRGEVGGGAVYFGCWRTGHGDHRPTLVCLAHHRNSSFFTLHLTTPSSYFDLTRPSQKLFVLHASLNYATVLLWFAGLFTPLSHGDPVLLCGGCLLITRKMRWGIKYFYKRGWFFIFYHDLCSVITNKE